MRRRGLIGAAAVLVAAVVGAPSYGDGHFGGWHAAADGLPAFRYTIDEEHDPRARQPELGGSTDAWHQVGNDHIVANAYNHGYVQLWSQDRRYQWVNRYDAATGHYAGGYGYLRAGGRTLSTLYDDRPAGARTQRDFEVGAYRKQLASDGLAVTDTVYAPFGDEPLLLHDVTIANTGRRARAVTWFEYWDVNPYDQGTKRPRGLGRPRYDRSTRTLSVAQSRRQLGTRLSPDMPDDARPLSIFAAALRGPDGGVATDARAFFGRGGRARPDAVARDHLAGAPAPAVAPGQVGRTAFVFRAPLRLKPGQRVTLRYAYGAAQPGAIARLVARYRRAGDPLRATRRAWARWLPRIDFGQGWLTRELAWSAYMLRSGATYEECRGRHIISQGGYYQYDNAGVMAYRDALQHLLPMIYADPSLAREVLEYSAQQVDDQPLFYGMGAQCQPIELGYATDLDLWMLLAAAEYGLATRDLRTFDDDLWGKLRTAFAHQESRLRPSGAYDAGTAGDWSDLSPTYLGMTESLLIPAQLAYIYPRLAELADLRGDGAFAAQLRAAGARDLETTKRAWVPGGWFARGYAGDELLGTGALFGEPQPWALLAGAADDAQAHTLIANIRRYLGGEGAPGGPARIGSSQSPAADDPGVTEFSKVPGGIGGGNAVFVGGSWFAVNGWLTWALGRYDPAQAFDELRRNTLATHATVYPDHWDGTISVDDVCNSWYSPEPANCGNGIQKTYAGQIMHQPAWLLFDAIKLAGVEPTRDGYVIDPRLPQRDFSLRLPRISVTRDARGIRGTVRPVGGGPLTLRVRADDGFHVIRLRARAGQRVAWALPR
jgi:cellobiose phosphorylase